MKNCFSLIILCVLISGCETVSSEYRPNDYYRSTSQQPSEDPLFGSSSGGLADKDIERILNHRLKLPAKNRIAILRLSTTNSWRFYSNDFTQLTKSMAEDFVGQLRNSERVYDASFLPSMLVPKERTIPFLREAAARFQADLLLAYRSSCNSYEKYKFINPNETKAYCSVEVVLLDVRSGIVPFTVVSSNEFSAKKNQDDNNFRETIKKAELAAISKSLKESAKRLSGFLSRVDRL